MTRVSTRDQHSLAQVDALGWAGCEHVFVAVVSGQLHTCDAGARPGKLLDGRRSRWLLELPIGV